jgi:hypothetical protein
LEKPPSLPTKISPGSPQFSQNLFNSFKNRFNWT